MNRNELGSGIQGDGAQRLLSKGSTGTHDANVTFKTGKQHAFLYT